MDITISFDTIYDAVGRTLSIVGKRTKDESGGSLYRDITLGTNEQPIVNDLIKTAVTDITVATSSYITATDEDSITLTFPVTHPSELETPVETACKDYCVAYVLYSWLATVHPELSKKYGSELQGRLASVVSLVYEKRAPGVPHYKYPTAIILRYPILLSTVQLPPSPPFAGGLPGSTPMHMMMEPWHMDLGQDSEITYTLVGEGGLMPFDDVFIRCDSPCCRIYNDDNSWGMKACRKGVAIVTLFSRHDDRVCTSFTVKVV